MTVRLIYGPPGAGKTTYAREHAQPSDLVIDLDEIRANVGSDETARKMRGLMESSAREHDGDVYIVRTLAKADERAEFMERVGVDEAIPLAVDADTAKERVRNRDGSDDKIPAIDQWWANYTSDDGVADKEEENVADVPSTEQTVNETPATAPSRQAVTVDDDGQEYNFPPETATSDMDAEQRAEYWRMHSRRHERGEEKLRAQLKHVSAATEERQAGAQPPAENPEVAAAQREVFEARLEAAVAKRPAFAGVEFAKYLNMSAFADESGRVDREAVSAFIESLPSGEVNTKNVGTPAGWGSNAPYEGASGVNAGRELHKTLSGKN